MQASRSGLFTTSSTVSLATARLFFCYAVHYSVRGWWQSPPQLVLVSLEANTPRDPMSAEFSILGQWFHSDAYVRDKIFRRHDSEQNASIPLSP